MTGSDFTFTHRDANTASPLSVEERDRRLREAALPDKLRPAVLQALAYIHVVGWMPKHVHSRTFCDALKCTLHNETKDTQYGPMLLDGKMYVIDDRYLEQVEAHPLVRAVRVLEGKGFKVRKHDRSRTTHFVSMMGWDDERDLPADACAHRSGYWSVGYGRESGHA